MSSFFFLGLNNILLYVDAIQHVEYCSPIDGNLSCFCIWLLWLFSYIDKASRHASYTTDACILHCPESPPCWKALSFLLLCLFQDVPPWEAYSMHPRSPYDLVSKSSALFLPFSICWKPVQPTLRGKVITPHHLTWGRKITKFVDRFFFFFSEIDILLECSWLPMLCEFQGTVKRIHYTYAHIRSFSDAFPT